MTTPNKIIVVAVCVVVVILTFAMVSMALVRAKAYQGPSSMRGIVNPEGFEERGGRAFLLPTAFGGVCYLLATLGARFISPVPRHIYFARLALMLVFLLAWWAYYCNAVAFAWSGPPDRYVGPGPKNIGTLYGAHTIWAWCLVALIAYPKRKNLPHISHSTFTA